MRTNVTSVLGRFTVRTESKSESLEVWMENVLSILVTKNAGWKLFQTLTREVKSSNSLAPNPYVLSNAYFTKIPSASVMEF